MVVTSLLIIASFVRPAMGTPTKQGRKTILTCLCRHRRKLVSLLVFGRRGRQARERERMSTSQMSLLKRNPSTKTWIPHLATATSVSEHDIMSQTILATPTFKSLSVLTTATIFLKSTRHCILLSTNLDHQRMSQTRSIKHSQSDEYHHHQTKTLSTHV